VTQVKRSDVLFATLSKPEQYGTVSEIVVAAEAGKPVFLAVDEKANIDLKDYWFVIAIALGTPYHTIDGEQLRSFQTRWKSVKEYEAYWTQLKRNPLFTQT